MAFCKQQITRPLDSPLPHYRVPLASSAQPVATYKERLLQAFANTDEEKRGKEKEAQKSM
ncbi:hypothetical protein AAY473_013318 [Plecturocebus cupreus]